MVKHSAKAEADRFFNYPYAAIEEAISNAVYHKSYELRSPIEIQVFPDKITILSHPGPVPPVNAQVLATQRQIIAREYRNRRIGDLLKELHLTEGRGTGFPTIYNAMEANGSPKPSFDTDESTYFLVTFLIHPSLRAGNQAKPRVFMLKFSNLEDIINYCNRVSDQASDQASDQVVEILNTEMHTKVEEILTLANTWVKREDIFEKIGLSNHSKNRKKYLDPLVEIGWIGMQYPEKRTHPNQRYKITRSGIRLLNLIEKNR